MRSTQSRRPSLRLVVGAGHAPDDVVRNVDAGHVRAHPLRGLRRAQRPDAHEDERAVEQAEIAGLRHEGS